MGPEIFSTFCLTLEFLRGHVFVDILVKPYFATAPATMHEFEGADGFENSSSTGQFAVPTERHSKIFQALIQFDIECVSLSEQS